MVDIFSGDSWNFLPPMLLLDNLQVIVSGIPAAAAATKTNLLEFFFLKAKLSKERFATDASFPRLLSRWATNLQRDF